VQKISLQPLQLSNPVPALINEEQIRAGRQSMIHGAGAPLGEERNTPMKRFSLLLIGLVALSALAHAYHTTHGQQTRPPVTGRSATPDIPEPGKGKTLVAKLPEGVEGVVLDKGVLKTKPGYKFVKKGKQVMVMEIASGGTVNAGGGWDCTCKKEGGGCTVWTGDNRLECIREENCGDECVLGIIFKKARTAIIQY
jgi:hypothetical protein